MFCHRGTETQRFLELFFLLICIIIKRDNRISDYIIFCNNIIISVKYENKQYFSQQTLLNTLSGSVTLWQSVVCYVVTMKCIRWIDNSISI